MVGNVFAGNSLSVSVVIFNKNTSLFLFKNLDGDEDLTHAVYVFKAGAPIDAKIVEEYSGFVNLDFKELGTAFGVSRDSFINLP